MIIGTFPNVGRNAIVNVAEIVCYDIIKELIIKRRIMDDNVPCHFTSAVIAGKNCLTKEYLFILFLISFINPSLESTLSFVLNFLSVPSCIRFHK